MIRVPFDQYKDKLTEYYCVEIVGNTKKEYLSDVRFSLRSNLNYGYAKRFQDWLFEQGIIMVRENKKMYLQFLNEQDATMFGLKWL